MSQLKDKVAIVTGGAGGIGTCIAMEYAKAGAVVVIASRTQKNLDKVAENIRSSGGECLVVASDVTDPAQVDNMIQQTVGRYGRLDIMVNNAGGALYMKPAEVLSFREWREGIALNLDSVFLCSAAAGKEMIKRNGGKIINISSVAGIKTSPNFVHYGAAKAGVISLTKSLAESWGPHNITVNCIAPGLTATEGVKDWLPPDKKPDGTPVPVLQLPSGPEHVANLAVFLGSAAADRITGETIPLRSLVSFDR
ncbi:MAG: SDR family NAD(P)-dependent oxidoreductase [Pseudomonadales bacterium]|jgi:3-oxoacyl-[acyl-carrier protein] reductase|nr:SDR family NAD(P)-dependent oxidoreductase [Pseudomonadales bacterium]MDP7147035.1 SDR family NAD(P)-dependent oxidoreductase [Pseudomonadales bacterium]MDP7359193.1 SDR family NAD(P)-dependent oxidoreductase [Pseudomonadales bacterium]MDP7596141.1 SDR family NAD(P)-dependent oxidoreductase [Pseudomonadales bacterium]HJN50691.1 SDR family NAD(P)-dependent oxidoreductase [Pseudomonadales bacterium]|tara:strand:+ start:411 stop:1166 length:756 start_codon:yes stop_codon:yes gene_type:complete